MIFFLLQASLLLPFNSQQQFKGASAIVDGTIVSKRCRKSIEGRVVTDFDIKVERSVNIKEQNIIVTIPGGTFFGETFSIEGIPTLQVGERAIFIVNESDHRYYLHNMELSIYMIKGGIVHNYAYPQKRYTYDEFFTIGKQQLIGRVSMLEERKNDRQLSSLDNTSSKQNMVLYILLSLLFALIGIYQLIVIRK